MIRRESDIFIDGGELCKRLPIVQIVQATILCGDVSSMKNTACKVCGEEKWELFEYGVNRSRALYDFICARGNFGVFIDNSDWMNLCEIIPWVANTLRKITGDNQ